jgi:hypothetical protein
MADATDLMLRLGLDHRERLRGLQDPYTLLVEIENYVVAAYGGRAARARYTSQFYARFIGLTALYPRADQDMLVHAAKRVFKVCVPTMRADIDAARAGVA